MKPTDLQPEAVQQLLEPMLTTGARDAASRVRRLVCLPMAVFSQLEFALPAERPVLNCG